MKKAYYYLFYKLYKNYERGPSVWMSDWKASFSLDVLIYFLVMFLFIYYNIFINRYANLSKSNIEVYILVISVSLLNYFIFHHRNQWKKIIVEFDQLPKKKNILGSWVVFGVVLFIVANLIFSFYLMSKIDWSQYR
ncbi:MAG: hypothetical protein J6O88_10885 [Chryseobacterium sp.]|uniref:hypothetical protein n=1 Tax=Chryseobacterium sp. TaxID=1871047 RepID=UPI001B255FD3|nr:hypothetical protein [Chryseobacterium sp.]MBO6185169.1 hypothetical protein [Chryseobacterium sp.]